MKTDAAPVARIKREPFGFFVGEDWMIRFYKDPEEYEGWVGDKKEVITVAQSMNDPKSKYNRHRFLNFTTFDKATRSFTRKLYGPGNENSVLKEVH